MVKLRDFAKSADFSEWTATRRLFRLEKGSNMVYMEIRGPSLTASWLESPREWGHRFEGRLSTFFGGSRLVP